MVHDTRIARNTKNIPEKEEILFILELWSKSKGNLKYEIKN